jgi:hypothetical protein
MLDAQDACSLEPSHLLGIPLEAVRMIDDFQHPPYPIVADEEIDLPMWAFKNLFRVGRAELFVEQRG